MRKAGVLMNISSLPGRYGIGTFGREARYFVDFLADCSFSLWQVLPLGTLDRGFSPYASDCAFAGNPLYIDPDLLFEKGLLSPEERRRTEYYASPFTVDYKACMHLREAMFDAVVRRATPALWDEARQFAESSGWLADYALFRALKDTCGAVLPSYAQAKELTGNYRQEIDRTILLQYLFFSQWKDLKAYANRRGIEILGDIPIYLSADGFEFWKNPELFQTDGEGHPTAVAGVPPDYFSEDGQLWGNPLYNWKAMEQNGFSFWVQRMEHALSLYDLVRIDHFRGLASYWSVPAEAKTAREGHWEKGPGMALFDALRRKIENPHIIAEDLGAYGEDVVSLLHKSGFPGMRVIQFGFMGGQSEHLPHNYSENTVAYTGTHDNNTLLGWLWEMTPPEREMLFRYIGYSADDWQSGGYQAHAVRAIIEAVWKSHASLAILPFQDMCGYGKDTRMNIPGIPQLNWRYRATLEVIDGVDRNYFRSINSLYGRNASGETQD